MKAYSLDLRQKVLAAALRGDHTIREVAELFSVGTSFVNKLLDLHRTGQEIVPRPHGGGYPARLLPRHEKLLRSRVRQHQDATTFEELRAHLEEQSELSVSVSTVSRALIRLDLGRKKRVVSQTLC
jgi:transposase